MDAEESETGARLRITRAVLRTPGLAIAVLVAVLAAAEMAARTDVVRAWLTAPSVGSRHRQFEVELAKLDRLVRREGPIDHLFIGNSVVLCGVDPLIVRSAYRELGGNELRGFTFGISGMMAPTTGIVAEMLVARYRPTVLVYGVSAVDLIDDPRLRARVAIEQTPWVRYRLGQWTLAGWMTEHSSAYRQYLPYRTWRGPGYAHSMMRTQRLEQEISPYGFRAGTLPGWGTGRRRLDRGANARLRPATYEISPDARAGLARIARLHRAGVSVILVEVPVPSAAISALPDGERGYQSFIAAIDDYAAAEGMPFWPTRGLGLVPPDGWRDKGHMNPTGARRFSRWLGARLAGVPRAPAGS